MHASCNSTRDAPILHGVSISHPDHEVVVDNEIQEDPMKAKKRLLVGAAVTAAVLTVGGGVALAQSDDQGPSGTTYPQMQEQCAQVHAQMGDQMTEMHAQMGDQMTQMHGNMGGGTGTGSMM